MEIDATINLLKSYHQRHKIGMKSLQIGFESLRQSVSAFKKARLGCLYSPTMILLGTWMLRSTFSFLIGGIFIGGDG